MCGRGASAGRRLPIPYSRWLRVSQAQAALNRRPLVDYPMPSRLSGRCIGVDSRRARLVSSSGGGLTTLLRNTMHIVKNWDRAFDRPRPLRSGTVLSVGVGLVACLAVGLVGVSLMSSAPNSTAG